MTLAVMPALLVSVYRSMLVSSSSLPNGSLVKDASFGASAGTGRTASTTASAASGTADRDMGLSPQGTVQGCPSQGGHCRKSPATGQRFHPTRRTPSPRQAAGAGSRTAAGVILLLLAPGPGIRTTGPRTFDHALHRD